MFVALRTRLHIHQILQPASLNRRSTGQLLLDYKEAPMKMLILSIFLLVRGAIWADFLELKHTASLKSEPRSKGDTVASVQPPAAVILIDRNEQNGYYHVRV